MEMTLKDLENPLKKPLKNPEKYCEFLVVTLVRLKFQLWIELIKLYQDHKFFLGNKWNEFMAFVDKINMF